jgi:hypothetical protein
MTKTSRAIHPSVENGLRATRWLGLVSGAALVVDTVTIAVINRSFDPLDSILFLIGFAGMWLTAGAVAVTTSAGHHGAARITRAVGAFLATVVLLGAISVVFDQMGRHAFSPANRGLHGEWSFFSIGVTLLVLATWADRRVRNDRRSPQLERVSREEMSCGPRIPPQPSV